LSSTAKRNYTIEKKEDKLIFTTPSFTDELDSVLHSGIYNREFTSMLASAAVAGGVYVLVAMNINNTLVSSMLFLLVFAAGFPFFRKYIFRERLMEVVFNKAAGKAVIYKTLVTKKVKETIVLGSIKDISIESRKREVENPDAVKFIEKISLQHGTVIPGFGEEKVLFLLKLYLMDGSERTIYSDKTMQDVISAHDEIKGFLGLA
jgi:hypothetical protein